MSRSDTTTVPREPEARKSNRIQRGIALHRERGAEIERISAHTYSVPSCSGAGDYTVWTDLRACECPDHPTAKALGERCKHVVAATLTRPSTQARISGKPGSRKLVFPHLYADPQDVVFAPPPRGVRKVRTRPPEGQFMHDPV